MKTNYEYIVLGCGGIGSGTAYWLSRTAGADVLGLEQYALSHPYGGSQDYSRIIRLTYHDPVYTRLTPHTYTAWATLEEETAVQVVTKTGSVQFAQKESRHQREIELYAAAMDAADIPYDRFDGDELMRRYPQFRVDTAVDVLFQAESGIASPQKGNAAHIASARRNGATILDHCPVKSIRPFEGGVEVETEKGVFSCRRLVMTTGAWTDKLLAELNYSLSLTVSQEQVTYFATPNLSDFSVGRFPIFIAHEDQVVYGFPVYGEVATKAAIDSIYRPVTVDTRTFEGDPEVDRQLEAWLARHIPGFLGPKLYTKTCLYTMPRDRNFVVDTLPEYPQISVCVGAGHAYKFASLLGKILSQLAMQGESEYPIEAFSLRRPAITDSNYQSSFHI